LNAVIACSAVELDRQFEKLIAYVHDDLNCRFPSIEILARLTASDPLSVRSILGPLGKLQSSALLVPFGEQTTQARTQLKLGVGVFEFLLGDSPKASGVWDAASKPSDVAGYEIDSKVIAMLHSGELGIVGLWGQDARAIATSCLPNSIEVNLNRPASVETVDTAIHRASLEGTAILVDTDRLLETSTAVDAERSLLAIGKCGVPAVLFGESPWRPTSLLSERPFIEIHVGHSVRSRQIAQWQACFPEMEASDAASVSAQYGFSGSEILAASKVAHASAQYCSNGKPVSTRSQLDKACLLVASKQTGKYVSQVQKKRGPDDLVLPKDLHRQVLEIGRFATSLACVSEQWGFGRIASGKLGIKCLFAGDPGTGKTLAAEVIATLVDAPLLKVNLAQTVSKWVGETEKNVDAAFEEAAASRAILFFDEADALFGKRGDVKQGVDRYANLEVSHLLQRLEDHAGVVILASNLKDNIDPAFLRRFQTVLHFPRPLPQERERIWRIAFPQQAPLTHQFSSDMFAKLDLTGAGIVNAARTAALLAASEHSAVIELTHIVEGIKRQFRQDGRMISPHDFGEHAHLIVGT
ncbi:MAG: ATP-binding protein, partial [Planctomycetota bacterium]